MPILYDVMNKKNSRTATAAWSTKSPLRASSPRPRYPTTADRQNPAPRGRVPSPSTSLTRRRATALCPTPSSSPSLRSSTMAHRPPRTTTIIATATRIFISTITMRGRGGRSRWRTNPRVRLTHPAMCACWWRLRGTDPSRISPRTRRRWPTGNF